MFAPFPSKPSRIALLLALGASLGAQGCGAPTPDLSSADGKQQIEDGVNAALTYGHCTDAVNLIKPLYDSSNTDDNVRMLTASAYGCDADVDFLPLLGEVVSNISTLSSGPYTLFTQLFPSTIGQDYVVEGALYATDALQATLNPGAVVLVPYQVNPGTYNVGSVWGPDRTSESNLYMIFIEMAAIGGIQNRYGNPDPTTFAKGNDLPWVEGDLMDANGAAYAASILNFYDAINAAGSGLPTGVGTALSKIATVSIEALNFACDAGCLGTPSGVTETAAVEPSGGWHDTQCRISGGCATCPQSLRDRTKATFTNTDEISCAAAGIVNFINVQPLLGWP